MLVQKEIIAVPSKARNTEPLQAVQPFVMTVPVPGLPEKQETYQVPGIIHNGDQTFMEGYGWGRDSYFQDTYQVVDPDGQVTTSFPTQEAFTAARSVKYRDVTSAEVMTFIQSIVMDEESGFSLTERLGAVVGYIVACTEEYHGLNCPVCGQSKGLCNHEPARPRLNFHHSDGWPLDM